MRPLIIVLLLLGSTACGQKGPLYFAPEKDSNPPPQTSEPEQRSEPESEAADAQDDEHQEQQ